MKDTTTYRLVASDNGRGRYALDHPRGQEIAEGDMIAILLGERWVSGMIVYMPSLYSIPGNVPPMHVRGGYCFFSQDSNICGLCVGMKVRLL